LRGFLAQRSVFLGEFNALVADNHPVEIALLANSGLMPRNKFVLFATSLPRLSIGCAITVWSYGDSWVAKPSQAVQYRRD
jgi:hypothetical protein